MESNIAQTFGVLQDSKTCVNLLIKYICIYMALSGTETSQNIAQFGNLNIIFEHYTVLIRWLSHVMISQYERFSGW